MDQLYGNAFVPYRRTGPGLTADGQPKHDLSQFNQAHFNNWFDIVSYANQRYIVVQIPLLDLRHNRNWIVERSGDITRGWDLKYDFYQDANNINGVDIEHGLQWFVPTNSAFEYQKALITKVIDTPGRLLNIVWKVASEPKHYPDGDSEVWLAQLADFITRYEKSLGLTPHLVETRDIPRHKDTPGHWLDPPAHVHEDLVARFSDDTPLISDDDCYIETPSADYRRYKYWTSLTAGAHVSLFHYLLYDTAVLLSSHAAAGMRYLGHLHRFVRTQRVKLADMVPAEELFSRGRALPQPGEGYVIYLPAGGATRVSGLPRHFIAIWFNPREGTVSRAAVCAQFIAADRTDWVLHIRRVATRAKAGTAVNRVGQGPATTIEP